MKDMKKSEYFEPSVSIECLACDILTESKPATDKDFELGDIPLA